MMNLSDIQTATLDQLTDELAAAGWDSTQTDIDEAREAVAALLRSAIDLDALRAEAAAAGDDATVRDCTAAMDGDAAALARCAEVAADVWAMDEEDPEDEEDEDEDEDEDAGVYTVYLRDDSDGAHSEEFTASPGTEEEQDAEAWAEAETIARQWAEDGDWGEDGASVRVTYWIEDSRGTYEDAERDITVDIEPDHAAKIRAAMTCCGELTGCGEDPEDHDWTGEGMGGCTENPGVWSLGGTTIHVAERCVVCGLVRKTTDPGSQRNPGDHVRVEYEPGEYEPGY